MSYLSWPALSIINFHENNPMKILLYVVAGLLIVLSLATILFGMTGASGAPQEAVVAGLACYFGILARIAQAGAQSMNK